jgi:hypothetical protein
VVLRWRYGSASTCLRKRASAAAWRFVLALVPCLFGFGAWARVFIALDSFLIGNPSQAARAVAIESLRWFSLLVVLNAATRGGGLQVLREVSRPLAAPLKHSRMACCAKSNGPLALLRY